jgi:DNA-directed RNA polymerase II subunit RPB2
VVKAQESSFFINYKGMEIARHVFQTFFTSTPNPLVRHHLDSYGDLLSKKIPIFIKASNPIKLTLNDNRFIHIYVGGKKSDEIKYLPPVDEFDNAILPHMCRLENKTYAIEIRVTIEIDYIFGTETETRKFENVILGKIPLMLKSKLCYISSMTPDELYDAGECKFELGGYFIVGGAEKVLLSQERLGDNMFYAGKRIQVPDEEERRGLTEKQIQDKIEEATKAERYEYTSGIRCISEDGTRGPYSHFLVIPPSNKKPDDIDLIKKTSDYGEFSTKRLTVITLPGFTKPVPVMSVFYALGFTSHKDIYDVTMCGVHDDERLRYDELFMELLLSHETFTRNQMALETEQDQDPDLLFLKRQTRTRSNGAVFVNLYSSLFPHCEKEENESTSSFYRRKGYLLGHMFKIAMNVALKIEEPDNRDHFRYKRIDAGGDLCFQEFRRIYKQVGNEMKQKLDSRIEFERQTYAGKKFVELVQPEKIAFYWKSVTFLNELEKSFKGKWDGKDGVSQELSRFSYLGTIAHLRRINLQMDKGTKLIEPRRIHGSSWGILCPTDNPDGGNVGMIKSFTLFSSLSTTSSITEMISIISANKNFQKIADIHPSTWDITWTKLFLNSDLVGVIQKDTESFHSELLAKRRKGEIQKFVSLCWSRLANTYWIFTDAGRPSRPIYREGVTETAVKKQNTWGGLTSGLMDFVDAQETESLRISMEPFSKDDPSEIHGMAIFSASASVVPNSDFNQAPRNMFSCQQVKQACSWFNTAFNKRFDTISTWLNYAQRPLSQTWTTAPILGGSGCMPYGENPIVALAIYSGYNQEDSILLNESALQRGMFHTTYYHSYDVAEEMAGAYMAPNKDINPLTLPHAMFANIMTNSEFKDIVIPNKDVSYEMLDADGIIRKGSKVTEDTVLVGIVVPKLGPGGQTIGYSDKSFLPKKAQHGIVDAVYRYTTPEGLHGVKIRVAEHRIPVLGDKFSARHGQKGTCGMRIITEDMPYTASGIIPDMIVNPHAFPSRMTIGQFIEMMSTKLGLHMGSLIDSTPFSARNRVGETKDLLLKAGYHPYGYELMYSGQTGEMLQAEIFIGPTYYIRSKLMTEDKVNSRATGPKKLLTHQPVEGRANEGGLRIGEMERDVLVSHGISKFLNESLMERSDKAEFLFQPETGQMDADEDSEVTTLTVPYALRLTVQELQSMHISVKLASN